MAGRIFISYRREENPMAVGLIRDRLMQEFGRSRVFFDAQSIDDGDQWRARIDRELERASVVVMIHGRQWAGAGPAGERRIDQPDDMVKYELVRAHEFGKHIVPLMIDAVPFPTGDALPDELRFLDEIQQRSFGAGASTIEQVDDFAQRLKGYLLGARPARRFVLHGVWIGLLCTSIVWLLAHQDLVLGARDAFDRAVQGIAYKFMERPPSADSEDAPHDMAVVAITRNEFAELFGGRTPLDPEVITILLDRWRVLSTPSMCQKAGGAANPVGIALELAPGNAGAGDARYGALAVALRRLAACRPVVLACPQSIGEPIRPASDVAWLKSLVAPATESEKPVFLASAAVQASVLRYSKDRSELGAAVGELARTGAAGSAISPDQPRHAECACPFLLPAGEVPRCNDVDSTPDLRSLVRVVHIPTRGLVDGLGDATVVGARTLLIGGDFQAQSNLQVPILSPASTPAIKVHAFDALSVGLEGASLGPVVEFAAGVLATMLGAIVTMMIWRDIGAHPHRYPRRLAGYLCVVVTTFGFPLALAFAAAWLPRTTPVASLAAVALALVALRASFTGCEILLARDGDWKPFDLRRDWAIAATRGLDRLGARLRVAVIACEALICVGAVVTALLAS